MTQPAFSRRIRALEEWLGADLFDRSSQPARLTAAGEWFRARPRNCWRAWRAFPARRGRWPRRTRRRCASLPRTRCRSPSCRAGCRGSSREPRWARSPGLRRAARCEALLLQSQVQFVMSHAHPQASSELQVQGFPCVRVGSDMLIPVSAPDASGRPRYPLAQATPSSLLPLLSYSTESGLGRILREVRGAALERCPAHSVFTAHLASVLRTMALDGRGMAWLPQTLIHEDLASGRLIEAAPQEWTLELEIRLYRDRSPMGKAAEEFWSAVCAAPK